MGKQREEGEDGRGGGRTKPRDEKRGGIKERKKGKLTLEKEQVEKKRVCSLSTSTQFAALCMLAGLPASHVLRAMALTAGAEVVIVLPLAEGLPLGAVAGAVAGAAAGVARGLGRRASGAGRLIAGALSRAVSSSFSSPPRPSPRLLSTSSNTEATAVAAAEAATATATAPASSLSALLSPVSSPPLSSLAPSSRRAGGDVGLRTWEEDGEAGFLSSLAAAFVAAARGRGGLF